MCVVSSNCVFVRVDVALVVVTHCDAFDVLLRTIAVTNCRSLARKNGTETEDKKHAALLSGPPGIGE